MMHSNTTLAVWALYLLGQSAHILKRAGMAVRSKANCIHSRTQYVAFFWDVLLVRVVLCAGLFWILLNNPRALSQLLALFGAAIPADVSVNQGSALIFGYFVDSVLDWMVSKIPWLQKELPVAG